MRIGFVWTEFSSYMAACWRELAQREGVELRVWVEVRRKGDVAFDPKALMGDVKYGWDYSDQITDIECRQVEAEILAFKPDVLFVCGWARELPPFVALSANLASVPKVLCCDMPWEWKVRKFAARFLLWRHLRRFRKILVPGRSAALYGRWLGFGKDDIVQGEYGIDVLRFREKAKERRGFVSIGRLVKDKNIKMLARAYQQYRALGGCWKLDVYGLGDEVKQLRDIDGLTVHGFVQPDELPTVLASAGAFVLASKWDPWPLVILESCAAGLPVICTDRCWDRYELIRENGTVVPSGDARAMARAMLAWERDLDRNAHGEKGRALAAEYSCAKWADRIIRVGNALRK